MRYIFFILLLLGVSKLNAQLFPSNNITLNHLQVMFEYPQVKDADCYKIQIAPANQAYDKGILYDNIDSSTAHLVNGLKFGNNYKWRYHGLKNGKALFTSQDYFFNTAKTKIESIFKANVTINDSLQAKPGLIFLDHGLVIDRAGNLILITDSFGVEKRDFSLTGNGSITYVQGAIAYDATLNGDKTWKSGKVQKNNTTIYGYHHDVTKLSNGNYLVMCRVKEKDSLHTRKNLDEGIVELDKKNNIKWLWKENDHITDTATIKTTHSNSIFLDGKENKIYVSSRDINTIFTIDRATGKIEKCIGYKLSTDAEHYSHNWFAGQHSAQLIGNGNILLFNNNARPPLPGLPSGILEINNPSKNNPEVSPAFIYIYDFGRAENHCAKGGDVNKLENGNYLISSSANNRNFEINAASEIVWQCKPERLDTLTNTWSPVGSYRINYEKSLYPSFFTIELVYENNQPAGYKITNKGTANDDYIIRMMTKNGKITGDAKISILAGKNKSLKFAAGKTPYMISAEARSNPGLFKEIKIK
jgi:hypothetical protein